MSLIRLTPPSRGARALGFRPDQVRVLPADRHFRLRPDALLAAMDADVQAGRQPLVVAASAGSTITGAVDPLPDIYDRHPGAVQPWLARQTVDVSRLRGLPLFHDVSDADLGPIAHSAYENQAASGQPVVRQWAPSSDFYLILDGTAEVRTAKGPVDYLGPGDFFGGLAALEWGARFGSPRLASVPPGHSLSSFWRGSRTQSRACDREPTISTCAGSCSISGPAVSTP